MTVQWLLSWWNLIFILPFGLGLLYLGLYTLGGAGLDEPDADGDFDHDIEAHLDVDGDASLEHDAELSHDVEADADADSDAHVDGHDQDHDPEGTGSNGSTLMAILSWLGVGRVPLSLLLMVLLVSWGTIGFCTNRLLLTWPIERSIPVAIGLAAVGSLLITRVVSSAVARYLPTSESYARRRHELLGCTGEALYPIDSTFGMVCGRDDRGEHFEVACRTEQNQPPITKGTPVKLVGYTAKERLFHVIPTENARV